MSKAVRSRSTRRDRRSHVAVEVALVEDGDFLAGGLVGAVDAEATSSVSAGPESHGSET